MLPLDHWRSFQLGLQAAHDLKEGYNDLLQRFRLPKVHQTNGLRQGTVLFDTQMASTVWVNVLTLEGTTMTDHQGIWSWRVNSSKSPWKQAVFNQEYKRMWLKALWHVIAENWMLKGSAANLLSSFYALLRFQYNYIQYAIVAALASLQYLSISCWRLCLAMSPYKGLTKASCGLAWQTWAQHIAQPIPPIYPKSCLSHSQATSLAGKWST